MRSNVQYLEHATPYRTLYSKSLHLPWPSPSSLCTCSHHEERVTHTEDSPSLNRGQYLHGVDLQDRRVQGRQASNQPSLYALTKPDNGTPLLPRGGSVADKERRWDQGVRAGHTGICNPRLHSRGRPRRAQKRRRHVRTPAAVLSGVTPGGKVFANTPTNNPPLGPPLWGGPSMSRWGGGGGGGTS